MKKFLLSLFAVAMMTATFVSCDTNQLQREVDEIQKDLPMDMGEGMTIVSVALDDSYLVYTAEIDESLMGEEMMDFFIANSDMLEESMFEVNEDDQDIKDLCKLCKDNNKGIAYKFVGTITGKELTVKKEASEL